MSNGPTLSARAAALVAELPDHAGNLKCRDLERLIELHESCHKLMVDSVDARERIVQILDRARVHSISELDLGKKIEAVVWIDRVAAGEDASEAADILGSLYPELPGLMERFMERFEQARDD